EPELAFFEFAPGLAEHVVVPVQALPSLGARWRLHLERTEEASSGLPRLHRGHWASAAAPLMPAATISSVSRRCFRSVSAAVRVSRSGGLLRIGWCCPWEVRKLPAVDTYRRRYGSTAIHSESIIDDSRGIPAA